jgi:hypothetical protein
MDTQNYVESTAFAPMNWWVAKSDRQDEEAGSG